jgi:hypothetical protein
MNLVITKLLLSSNERDYGSVIPMERSKKYVLNFGMETEYETQA